jgi:glycosyltransferase involved in cell wall biosynthesis
VTPLVSILIPAYNAGRSIGQTLASALAQTWPHKEVIVVDDGSRDATLSVARQFESRCVKVVTQENQGAAAARNMAYSLSQGAFIQWLDADDLISANKISRQMEALEEGTRRTLASSAWGYFRHRPASARFIPTPLWEDLAPLEWMLRKWEHNLHMQTATWLVSRELSEAAGAWDPRLKGDDDGEYFSRVITQSDGITFVPDARVYYRASSSARLSYIGASDAKMEAQFLGMELQIGYLRGVHDSVRVRRACVAYLQTWLPYFYPNRLDIVRRAQEWAVSLGGELHTPELSWKYDWIRRLFGWHAAKYVQLKYNERKSILLDSWDRALSLIARGDNQVTKM